MTKNYFIIIFFFICSATFAQQTDVSDVISQQEQVENEMLAKAIALYPNPVGEILKVRAKGFDIVKIEIFSILGSKVKEINSNFKSIYLGNLTRGIYMIKIYSNKGYTVKKLIKK